MQNLIEEPTVLDFGAHVDLFDLLSQVSAGYQSAGPVAGKTLVYKAGLYYHLFNPNAANTCKWYPFTQRNSYITDSSSHSAMNAKDESKRGYYTSSGTRLAINLVMDQEPVGANDDSIASHKHYSRLLTELRKGVVKRWRKTKVLKMMARRSIPKQACTYALCEFRMRLKNMFSTHGVPKQAVRTHGKAAVLKPTKKKGIARKR